MRFLVTGIAGFIGFRVARELLKLSHTVHRSANWQGFCISGYEVPLARCLVCEQLPDFRFLE
jgi:hypothetical protein